MPRRPQQRTSPGLNPPTAPGPAQPSLTDEQVDRWADLIVDGRDAFPDGLPPSDRERLLAVVRERLRGRLVRLVARAVAAQLRLRARPDTENTIDA